MDQFFHNRIKQDLNVENNKKYYWITKLAYWDDF